MHKRLCSNDQTEMLYRHGTVAKDHLCIILQHPTRLLHVNETFQKQSFENDQLNSRKIQKLHNSYGCKLFQNSAYLPVLSQKGPNHIQSCPQIPM